MTWKSISGHDNRLSDIGIDSAQMMRLSSMIHKRFGVKLLVDLLGSEDMTIRKLAALLASGNTAHADRKALTTTEAKIQLLRSRVAGVSESVLGINPSRRPHARHVFLTGATGYLGTRILVHLLRSFNISSVTVLVRSSGAEQALDRVKHAVLAAGADGEQCSNLRAWPGDLSQPRLGLSPEHWIELSGSEGQLCGGKRIIDTIIHCGAVVDWTKSYNELAPHNVGSTEQLLRLTLATPAVQRFIFISGGRYPDPVSDDRHDLDAVYAATAEGNAYAQTKFVSEQLVDKVRHAAHNKSIKTVSPAYLIGSRNDGLANQDDYIWRIIWASLRVGSYNADENDQWLFVAEAGCVAERIVALALQDRTHPQDTTLRILDGLSMQRMWENVCAVLKKPLTPVSAETWLQKVKQDMDETPNHLLWPLADTLEGSYGYLTQRRCAATDMGSAPSTGIDLAVRRNIEYLGRVGFFS
jgi:thioester reductase-like protein